MRSIVSLKSWHSGAGEPEQHSRLFSLNDAQVRLFTVSVQ